MLRSSFMNVYFLGGQICRRLFAFERVVVVVERSHCAVCKRRFKPPSVQNLRVETPPINIYWKTSQSGNHMLLGTLTRTSLCRHDNVPRGHSRYCRPHCLELIKLLCPLQARAGSEEAEGGAAEQPAERAGAAQPRLQPDEQREEPEARGGAAQAVQHAAPEQVSGAPCGCCAEAEPRQYALELFGP